VPRNYGEQTSIVSDLSLSGVAAIMTVEGAVDTLVFNTYVEKLLRPTLRASDVLVLDNLTAHRASCIERVAAAVIWLSPYFSPIEMMWSKIKAAMRAAKARSREQLEQALAAALELVTRADCLGWFRHCGCQVPPDCK
jgi:transposase